MGQAKLFSAGLLALLAVTGTHTAAQPVFDGEHSSICRAMSSANFL